MYNIVIGTSSLPSGEDPGEGGPKHHKGLVINYGEWKGGLKKKQEWGGGGAGHVSPLQKGVGDGQRFSHAIGAMGRF